MAVSAHARGTHAVCDCGALAVVFRTNARVCARCAALGERPEPVTAGVRERDPGYCGWVEVRFACNAFLHRAGLSTKFK